MPEVASGDSIEIYKHLNIFEGTKWMPEVSRKQLVNLDLCASEQSLPEVPPATPFKFTRI